MEDYHNYPFQTEHNPLDGDFQKANVLLARYSPISPPTNYLTENFSSIIADALNAAISPTITSAAHQKTPNSAEVMRIHLEWWENSNSPKDEYSTQNLDKDEILKEITHEAECCGRYHASSLDDLPHLERENFYELCHPYPEPKPKRRGRRSVSTAGLTTEEREYVIRQRNKQAAEKYRIKLKHKSWNLEAENERLKKENMDLKAHISFMQTKMANLEKILANSQNAQATE